MTGIIWAASEGEWAFHEQTLSATGADTLRRGSVDAQDIDQTTTWTAVNNTWFHSRAKWTYALGAINPDPYRLQTAGGTSLWFLEVDAGTSEYFLWLRNAAGSYVQVGDTVNFDDTVFQNIDVQYKVSTVTDLDDTLEVNFYVNQIRRGSTTLTDATGWDKPEKFRYISASFNVFPTVKQQEIIVTDSVPTVGMELVTIIPDGVGAHTAWTNDYTNIDEAGYNSTDAITGASVGVKESWTYANPTFTLGNRGIYAVLLSTVGQLDLLGTIGDIRPFFRISGVDYNGSAIGANSISPTHGTSVHTLNPATGTAWTVADLNALESGVEAIA